MLSPDLVDDAAAASGADTDTDIAKPSKKKTRRSRRGGRKHRRSQAKESEAEVTEGGSSAAHARAQTEQQNGSDGGFAGPGTGFDSCFDSGDNPNFRGLIDLVKQNKNIVSVYGIRLPQSEELNTALRQNWKDETRKKPLISVKRGMVRLSSHGPSYLNIS